MNLDKGRNKILLHLESQNDPQGKHNKNAKNPYAMCQKGIAEAVQLSRPRVSQIIKEMIEKGLVKKEKGRISGVKRRRMVYFLTSQGLKKAKKIREKLENKKITVKTESSEHELQYKEIDSILNIKLSPLEILNRKDENDVVNLTSSDSENKSIFTGRNDEIKTLFEHLKEVKNNGSKTIFIKGKAGVGKTRLINEFKNRLETKNIEFFDGKCYYDNSEPYLPLKKAFESYEKETDAKLLRFFEIEEKHNLESINQDQKIEKIRNLLFSETTNKLKQMAEDKTIILFLDDLQWADKASLRLFHYLADNLNENPILLIGAYRPEELNNNFLNEVISRMGRQHLYEEIELEELTWVDTNEIIQGLLGSVDVPEEFVHLIHDFSEGNPLYSKELVKQMVEEKIVVPNRNDFPTDENDLEIPRMIKDIIKRRFNNLPSDTLKVLQVGSIIGEKIDYSLLKSITDIETFDLLEHVDILTDLDIWENKSDDDLQFTHGLLRETVYEDISPPLRKELHQNVAESIKEFYKDDLERFYSELGLHYKKAGEKDLAFDYYLKAGEEAEKVYAQENALDFYEEALKLSEKADLEEERWKTLEKLGDVHLTMGEYEGSLHHYEEISMEEVDERTKQRILRKIGGVQEKTIGFEKALETINKGLEIKRKDGGEKGRLLYKKGLIEMKIGRYETAIDTLTDALDISEANGKKNDIANIYHALGSTYSNKDRYDKGLKFLEKGLKIKKEINDTHGKAFSYTNIGSIYLKKGKIEKALDNFNKAMKIFKKVGDKGNVAMLYSNLGNCYMKKGNLEEAYKNHKKSNDIFERLGNIRGVNISLNNLGNYYLLEGDLENSLKYYEKSIEMSKENNLEFGVALGYNNLGTVQLHKQNDEKAKEYYQKSINKCEKLGNKKVKALSLSGLSEVHIKKGEFDKAEKCANEALEISKSIGSKVEIGILCRSLGKLYREKNELYLSKDYFQKGDKILDEIGEKTELAKLMFEKAFLWKKMDDLDKYEETLQKACSMFKNIGMGIWVKKCKKEKAYNKL